ncbi:unnamed protein product [Ixodes hexagonus]
MGDSSKNSEACDSPFKIPSIQSIDLDESAVEAFLSFGPRTPATADADLAEERHLHELALQFEPSPVSALRVNKTVVPPGISAHKLPVHPASSPSPVKSENAEGASSATSDAAELSEASSSSVPSPAASVPWTPCSSLFGTPKPVSPTAPARIHGIVPQLQNIVATVDLCCRLDLRRIALMARNAEYNPRRFAAVIMRIREPRTTALLFQSGKVVCTGAKREDHSRVAARKFARITQKLGFNAQFSDFKIQNIVASADVGFLIKLEALALNHPQFSCYEPELFPGLVYRMVRPSILLLVFVSGKVVLTGAKVRQQLYQAFDNIYPILEKYRSV